MKETKQSETVKVESLYWILKLEGGRAHFLVLEEKYITTKNLNYFLSNISTSLDYFVSY